MAHTALPYEQTLLTTENLKIRSWHTPHIPVYTLFSFAITALLIMLAIRMIGALLLSDSIIVNGATALTQPFVSPFSQMLHDQNSMIQLSSGLTFTAFYGIYWIGALTNRFFGKTV